MIGTIRNENAPVFVCKRKRSLSHMWAGSHARLPRLVSIRTIVKDGFCLLPRAIRAMVIGKLGDNIVLGLVCEKTDEFCSCAPDGSDHDDQNADNANAQK